jgi:predicted transcriptional regulator of viral defense system
MQATRKRPTRTGKLQRLFEVAATQAGYFTAAQARALGYSPRSLVHHVAAGHVDRAERGLYRMVGVPATPMRTSSMRG